MKILHVITRSDLGGAQSVVINLANTMCAHHDVTVVAGENGPMWNALNTKVQKIKIDEIVREVSILKDAKVLWKLYNINKKLKPDVIHLHSSKIGFLGRLAFPSKKIVYTVHGFDSIRIAHRKFLFIEKLLKNFARKIVAVSNYDFKMLQKHSISSKVVTIYNGIEDCCKQDLKNNLPYEIFSKLEYMKQNHFVVMVIARISPQKKFELFCKIARQMRDDDRFVFVWIGNTSPIDTNEKNILILGEIPNASQCYRYADIALLPSNYEGLPISIIEALSLGIPVIASDVGGISEILDGENGYAVNNDAKYFIEKLKELADYEEIYQRFSLNARKTYLKKFTIKEMADQYEKIYFE